MDELSLDVDCGAIDAELLDATSARRSSSFPTTLTGIAMCFFSAVTSDADTADDDSVSGAEESCGEDEDAIASVNTPDTADNLREQGYFS